MNAKQSIVEVLFGWIVLSILGFAVTGEYTLRHLLFPLATSVIVVWCKSFQERREWFWAAFFCFSAPLLSLLAAHWWVPTDLRFWELGTYLAFATAIAVFATSVIPLAPCLALRTIISFITASVLVLIAGTVLGDIWAEGAWPNADSVYAILQTNPKEAASYVRDALGWRTLFIVLPAVLLVLAATVTGRELRIREFNLARGISFALLLVLCIVGLNRTRENILTIPVYEVKGYVTSLEAFKKAHLEYASREVPFSLSAEEKQGGLFVLVIGESATRDHFSVFGYGRETTPWMDSLKGKDGFFFYPNAYACYTTTAKNLAYALTSANQYTGTDFEQSPSLLDVAKRAGYKTVWLSNQVRIGEWDNANTVIAETADERVWLNTHSGVTLLSDFPDGMLVEKFHSLPKSDDMVIIFHLMGSHNSYQDRYPPEFAKFTGVNTQVNEYDGSLLYTDYVLQKIYEEMSQNPNFQAMVYFSDHGDAVDTGHFHSSTNFEWQMVRIPLFVALSPSYAKRHPEICAQLKAHESQAFTNVLIFDLMMGLTRLKGEGIYDGKNDLSSAAYDGRAERFLTMYGKKHILEDDGK